MNAEQKNRTLTPKAVAVILVHALVGWALCGSIVAIGREIWTMETTLNVHAIEAPIIFGALSLIYFTYFSYTTPLQTAAIFMFTAIFMDLTVVATLIEKSYEMFTSLIGTWIPFALMFLSTYLVGSLIVKRKLDTASA